jgi:hypothetical protein
MKTGDLVKAKVEGKWKSGKVLKASGDAWKVGIGEPHYFNYEERDFLPGELKRHQPQTDEAHNANLERDLPIGLALAQEAFAALLPGEVVTFKDADNTLSGYHGAVTIDPVQFDQETIGAFIERTGYQVTEWKYHHATRTQPEEYVDAPVGTFPTIGAAVQEFVKTVFALKSRDYWDHKADEAQAAQWEEDNAGGEAYIGGYR